MIIPENNNLNDDNLNLNNINEENLDQNDLDQSEGREDRENRKTIYKETADPVNEDQQDPGDSSSAADIGRTDFVRRPQRDNSPLGSSHEPGTM